MNPKERIHLNMTYMNALMVMSEGNPGALRVMMDLAAEGPKIDPDSALAEWGPMLGLDSYAIYGSDIWLFYKDLCGQSYVRMEAVMRAVQLGLLSQQTLTDAIEYAKAPWDKTNPLPPELITELHHKVCEQLPRFKKPETVGESSHAH